MSRQNVSNKHGSRKNTEQKKFCKVCFDAGKSETEYTSHFVRASPEPTAKVVCPTLLQAECGYCHEIGHTPSCCSTLKAHQKAKKRQEYELQKEKSEATKSVSKASKAKQVSLGGFAALMEDDSDSETEFRPVAISNKTTGASQQKSKESSYSDSFPVLAASKPATIAQKVKPAVAKPQFLVAIEKTCPTLKIGEKMPEVNTYRPPMATLVRRPKETQVSEEVPASKPSEHYIADVYEEAFQVYEQKQKQKASEMDWAQLDSESSDEEDEDW